MRIVLDTNIVVSFTILARSRLGRIVERIFERHTVLYSEATFAELARTLSRPKLARYLDAHDIETFLRRYEVRASVFTQPRPFGQAAIRTMTSSWHLPWMAMPIAS